VRLTLRVDLDYVPWDSPDAADLGHGEPAALIRLLDRARRNGWKLHFFASNRHLRAFPASGDAVLNDGHHLDWLCKHPSDREARQDEANRLFQLLGVEIEGWAIRDRWPTEAPRVGLPRFISLDQSAELPCREFPVDIRMSRSSMLAGLSVRAWTDAAIATVADSSGDLTMAVRLQALAKFDSHLAHLSELISAAEARGYRTATLRDRMGEIGSSS